MVDRDPRPDQGGPDPAELRRLFESLVADEPPSRVSPLTVRSAAAQERSARRGRWRVGVTTAGAAAAVAGLVVLVLPASQSGTASSSPDAAARGAAEQFAASSALPAAPAAPGSGSAAGGATASAGAGAGAASSAASAAAEAAEGGAAIRPPNAAASSAEDQAAPSALSTAAAAGSSGAGSTAAVPLLDDRAIAAVVAALPAAPALSGPAPLSALAQGSGTQDSGAESGAEAAAASGVQSGAVFDVIADDGGRGALVVLLVDPATSNVDIDPPAGEGAARSLADGRLVLVRQELSAGAGAPLSALPYSADQLAAVADAVAGTS